jgi:hypothetical protein
MVNNHFLRIIEITELRSAFSKPIQAKHYICVFYLSISVSTHVSQLCDGLLGNLINVALYLFKQLMAD